MGAGRVTAEVRVQANLEDVAPARLQAGHIVRVLRSHVTEGQGNLPRDVPVDVIFLEKPTNITEKKKRVTKMYRRLTGCQTSAWYFHHVNLSNQYQAR